MRIKSLQAVLLYISIFIFSIYLLLINDIYSGVFLNNIGTTVTMFWLLCSAILLLNGINKASSTLYFGFFIVLGLFHLGIPLSSIFGYEGDYFITYINRWFYSDYTVESFYAVYIFLIGYLLSFFFSVNRNISVTKKTIFDLYHSYLGAFFYIFTAIVITWITIVKFVYKIDNYTIYQESTQIPVLNFAFVYLNQIIGFLLIILCTSTTYAKRALLIFFVWTLVAFPLGLRGEVIFPLVISLPLLVVNNTVNVTYTKAALGVLILLTLSSIVFIYRGEDSSNKQIDVSPLATVAELGGSLRPVYEVTKWTKNNEMNFQYGATYYAPFERTFLKVLPLKERLPATEDLRLMNVAIADKAGPYGFSIIAEAKINFSWLGVFIIGLLSGTLLRVYDKRLRFNKLNIIDLSLIFALFFQIRQSFVGAFGIFIITFSLSLIVILFININRKVI